jgi:hypothetical protein
MIMFTTRFRDFLRDESGGYTVWSLVWFSIYVAMGGLAVDITDAYRNQTLLQSTADASALAAVMSLPDQDDAVNQALAYSTDNMVYAVNGAVLDENEIFFGNWDSVSRTFTENLVAPDAVRVITRRDDNNSNPLAANFLRILSLWGIPFDRFNIAVDAIAEKFLPDCIYKNGLIAGNRARVESNNTFSQICIHGENLVDDPGHDYAVDISNGNEFYETVDITFANNFDDRPNLCQQNETLCNPNKYHQESWGELPEVGAIEGIVYRLLNDSAADLVAFVPGYIGTSGKLPDGTDDSTEGIADNILTVGAGDTYTFTPGNIYRIICNGNTSPISLPTDGVAIERVIIATNCNINASHAASVRDVIIASDARGSQGQGELDTTVHFASDADIGDGEFCIADEEGHYLANPDATGQVSIYAMASVSVTANSNIQGLLVWAKGDLELTAGGEVGGISAVTGNDIRATSNGSYSFCGGVFTALEEFYRYTLVD